MTSDGELDFSTGLGRLQQDAALGIEQLGIGVKREQLLLRSVKVPSTVHTEFSKHAQDPISNAILSEYYSSRKVAIRSSANGNCLFNAFSTHIIGNESMRVELRYRCCIEMVSNKQKYMRHRLFDALYLVSPPYDQDCIDCTYEGQYASMWHILAMSNHLKIKVDVVYPAVNGTDTYNFKNMNRLFKPPFTDPDKPTISIMWTSTFAPPKSTFMQKQKSDNAWKANHFVPLVICNQPIQKVKLNSPDKSPQTMHQSPIIIDDNETKAAVGKGSPWTSPGVQHTDCLLAKEPQSYWSTRKEQKNKRQPEVKPAVQPEVPQTKAAVGKGRKEQKRKPTKAAVGKGKSPGVQPEVKPSVQPEVPQTKAAVGKGSPWTSPGVQHTDCLLAKSPEVVQPEVPQTKAAVGKGSPWTSPGVQHTDCLLAKAPEVVQPEVQQTMRDTSAEHSFNVSTLFHDTSTVEEHSLADASLSNNVVEDGPTTFEIVPGGTAKGKDMLLDSLGYSYNVRVVRNKTRNWCCSVRNKRIRCPATVIEKNNMFKRGVHDHAHQADPGKKHTVKLTRKVKDEAVSNVYQPANKIVEDKMMNELRDDDFALPDPDLLKRKANRYRQKTRTADPRGMDFKVAEDFIPEGFLRHDITVDGARHIIFATDTQLDILRRAKTWYVDGTFKCLRAKDPFMQLFSIHAFIKKDGIMKQVPLAFVFMSRRRKKDYRKVLKKVKSTFDSPPSVERVVMDFEAAVWSAFRKVFPLVSLHGCAFHWSQAVFRKVQALGLSGEYTEKGPCHEFIRQVLALPLLPAEHIRPAFSKLTSRSTAQLMPLMGYVDTTWISGPWKVEEWSVFGQSIRTNNDCEGWHRRLNYRCVGPPPFYLLVRSLHEEARLLPIQVKLITERKLSKDQRKKSRSIQALVFAVWGRYSAGEISTSRLLKRLAAVYAPSS